ncbi:hypothetical protein B0H10DRAFT_2209676 [Mycena sp. CBHHK59/15]|nr:hypothetical protein B0H10DRAFT_2209676 [Mycena sp. CBHHK59/15]
MLAGLALAQRVGLTLAWRVGGHWGHTHVPVKHYTSDQQAPSPATLDDCAPGMPSCSPGPHSSSTAASSPSSAPRPTSTPPARPLPTHRGPLPAVLTPAVLMLPSRVERVEHVVEVWCDRASRWGTGCAIWCADTPVLFVQGVFVHRDDYAAIQAGVRVRVDTAMPRPHRNARLARFVGAEGRSSRDLTA